MKKILNLDYGAIHGTYWMSFGIVYSFASVFLLARGYSNTEIGVILAAGNGLAVFLQPVLANFADRSKKVTIIGLTQAMTIMLMIMTFFTFILKRQSMSLTVCYVLMIAWVVILQPFFNSLSFRLQESGYYINFGVTRAFGSFTYAILCGVLGTIIEKKGNLVLPITGEIVLVMLLISLILTRKHFYKAKELSQLKSINENNEIEKKEVDNTIDVDENITMGEFIKRHKMFFVINIGVVGVFFSNQILNSFMLQIVTNVGGNSEDMGRVFFVLAFLEIPTLVFFDKLRARFRCQSMIKVASVCYTLEIWLCHIAQSVELIFAAQLFQLVSFGLFMPSMVHLTDDIMSKGEAVRGQSLYIMMTTITTIIGTIIGGWIIDISGVNTLTLLSTIVTLIGTAIMWTFVEKVK